MFPITALVPLNFLPSFSYYPKVYALVLLFLKTPKRASIIKAFIGYIQCFYCLLFQDLQNETERYVYLYHDIVKHINEASNK